MVDFIEESLGEHGVEPICAMLPIAPATYYEERARRADPERRPARQKRDEGLKPESRRVWEQNFAVYGADRVCRRLRREDVLVARCTVERLGCPGRCVTTWRWTPSSRLFTSGRRPPNW